MPSILYTRTREGAFKQTILIEKKNVVWYHSKRNSRGELIIGDNPFGRQNVRTIKHVLSPSNANSAYYVAGSPPYLVENRPEYKKARERLEAESYARLRGRLYKGSAALGVTIGSWRQSREMIVTRYRQMSLQSDRFEVYARKVIRDAYVDRNTKRRSYNLKALADQYLELVFGWKPLLADIHAAATTVINSQPQAQRVSATAQTYFETDWVVEHGSSTKAHNRVSGVLRYGRGVTVEITNPNKWLAERAGLNNGFAVGWDLIPFSFVVNIFVNTGTLVNSITDFAGLSFPSSVTVNSHNLTYDLHVSSTRETDPPGGFGSWQLNSKWQKLGGVGRPPLITKLPEVSWELAGIAASVFIQKFRVLQVLTGPLIKR